MKVMLVLYIPDNKSLEKCLTTDSTTDSNPELNLYFHYSLLCSQFNLICQRFPGSSFSYVMIYCFFLSCVIVNKTAESEVSEKSFHRKQLAE